MKKHDVVLWLLFAVLLFIRCTVSITYWMVLALISSGIAVILLAKNKMPSKKYIIISSVLAIISTVAYLGYERSPSVLLYGLTAGIPTLISSLAVFSVMEKTGGYTLLSGKRRYSAIFSIMIAVSVGAFLSVVNILLSGDQVQFNFSIWKLMLALNPAVFEEIVCRAIFMAYCVYFAHSKKMNAFSSFTMYFMMFVPHTVAHGYDFITTIVLAVLFGLPFTILQRKRDIASAMISHGIVDAVRFTLIGLS